MAYYSYQFSAFLFLLSTLLVQQKLIYGNSTVESTTFTNAESTEAVTETSTTAETTKTVRQTPGGGQLNLKFVCSFSYKIYNETVKNGTENGEIVRPSILLRPVCCLGYKWNGTNCVPHCEGGCGEGVCKSPGVCICEKKFQYCHFGNYSRPRQREATNVSCLEKCKNGVCLPNNTCQCNKGFWHRDEWTIRYTNSSAECIPFCFPYCSNGLFSTVEQCECSYSYQDDDDDGDSTDFDIDIDKPKSFKKLHKYFTKYGHPYFGTGASLDSAAGHPAGFGSDSSSIGWRGSRPPGRTNTSTLNVKPTFPGSNNFGSGSSGTGSSKTGPVGTPNPPSDKPKPPGFGLSDSRPFGPETPWSGSRGVLQETPWNFNGPLGRAKPLSGSGPPPGFNNVGSGSPGFGSSFRGPPPVSNNFGSDSSGIGSVDRGPVGRPNPPSDKPKPPGFGSSDSRPFVMEPPWSGSRGVLQESPWNFNGPLGRAKPLSGRPPPGFNNVGSGSPGFGSSFHGPPPGFNNVGSGSPDFGSSFRGLPPGFNNVGSGSPVFGSSFRGPPPGFNNVGSGSPDFGSSCRGPPPRSNNVGSGSPDFGLSGNNPPGWRMPSRGGSSFSDGFSNVNNKPIGHKWDIPKISPSFHSSHIGGGTRSSIGGSRGGFRGRG